MVSLGRKYLFNFSVDPFFFFPFKVRNIYDFTGDIYNRWGEQVYKWTQIAYPDSLDLYIHRKLHYTCLKMVDFEEDCVKLSTKFASVTERYYTNNYLKITNQDMAEMLH